MIQKHIFTKSIFFIIALTLLTSCQNDFDKKEEEKLLSLHNNFEIINGTVKIESKQNLKSILSSYQKDVEGQNDFNEEIRSIQDKGFKPLSPIFGKKDSQKIKDFVTAKKQRLQKRNIEYGLTARQGVDEDIDIEDDLIQDPSLAAVLNENREIIIGDSLYKYTEHGLYFCLEKDKQKLYNYLNKLTPSTRRSLTAKLMPAPCTTPVRITSTKIFIEDEVADGVTQVQYIDGPCNGGYIPKPTSPKPETVAPTPKLIKSNLAICRIEKQGFFEKIFGETEVDTDDYGDGKRIKIKFWNQNYFIFSSLGCSARFQKREKLLGVSWWEKSYADQIELGINDVSYDYNYNVPVYNAAQYSYENFFIEINGIKYAGSGKQIIEFPTGASNFPFSGSSPQQITVYIFGYQIDANYDAIKIYNQGVDLAVKDAFKKIVSLNPNQADIGNKIELGDVTYNVVNVNPLSNKATISTQGLKWTNNNDNAITHYFDFNFLLSYNSNKNGTGDYLNGLQGSTKYTSVRADVYGAALHNNMWKGRRLILQ